MAVPASRVSRVVMTGPLVGFAEAYVLELRRRGYTPLTSVNQLRQVGRLSSWLATQGVGVAELTRERVEEFLAVQRAVGRHRSQWSRPGLLCLMEVLAGRGDIPRRTHPRRNSHPPPRPQSPVQWGFRVGTHASRARGDYEPKTSAEACTPAGLSCGFTLRASGSAASSYRGLSVEGTP